MKNQIGRRNFLKTSAAAVSGFTILKPKSIFGTQANSTVRLGIIGCGNRGSGVAASFMENTDTRVVAIAELFEDKLMKAKERFNKLCSDMGYPAIKNSHLFVGSKGYMRLLETKDIDAVQISTPTFLHSEILSDAVDAGKHIYCEKPVATDVYGCRRTMLAGKRADGRLSIAIGLQIRHATPFVEMVKRIHAGAIGDIVMGQAHYLSGFSKLPDVPPGASLDEIRIRNFYFYRDLMGGCILDQGVHPIDVCNWIMQSHPIKAAGIGGRKGRDDPGDIWSYFAINFEYPNNIPLAFQETQFKPGYGDVVEKFFGTKGTSESHYSGGVFIKGENEWDSGVLRAGEKTSDEDWVAGKFKSALEDADPNKEKAFIESIKSGNYINEAKQGAESTLSAILGRTAAYKGEEVTWDEMLASNEKWDPMIDMTQFDK